MAQRGKALPLQLVINDRETSVSIKFEIEDESIKRFFYGKKIGDIIEGDAIGFPGYKFQIRGGSDIAGFPHIKGLPGMALRKVLKSGPPGYRPKKYRVEKKTGGYKIINLKNMRRKKSVRGEELSEWTRQINMIIVERSGQKVEEMDEASILNDKILANIAEKVGKIVLRPGLKVLSIQGEPEATPMIDALKDLGLSDDIFESLYKKIGVHVIRLGDKKKIVIEAARKASKKHLNIYASHIIAAFIDIYNKIKNNEVDPSSEEFFNEFVNKIIDVINKYTNGELKERAKIKIKLPAE